MLNEFRDFINRGNLIDLAIAFVMGVAFSTVVSTFTGGVIAPLIGRIFQVQGLQAWTIWGDILIGAFVASVINFLIVGLVVFMIVKAYNRFKKPADVSAAGPSEEVVLLREIRDSLKK